MTTTAVSTSAPSADPAAPTPSPVGRPRLVRAEVRKILTTNTWWLFGIFILVATGLALLVNIVDTNQQLDSVQYMQPPDFESIPPEFRPSAEEQQRQLEEYRRYTDVPAILARGAASIYTSGQFFGLMLVMIVGALVNTNEFAHQTATATFLTTPQRTRVILAKLAGAIVLAGGYWLLATLFSFGVGALYFTAQGYGVPLADSVTLRAIGMNLLAYVLLTIFGVGLGVLIRSQLGATLTAAGLYLLSFPAGLLVVGFLREYVIHDDRIFAFIVAVPGIAATIMVSAEPIEFGPGVVSPSWWVAALVLLGYALLAGTVGTLITRRRDIS